MKTYNPFLSRVSEASHNGLYTFGIEVEFYATSKYFMNVVSGSSGVLGIDGAGKPTGEYRSPVFKSKSSNIAVKGAIRFTNQVMQYVMNTYPCTFTPMKHVIRKIKLEHPYWCEACNCYHTDDGTNFYGKLENIKDGETKSVVTKKAPLGIHFSLGGKYFSNRDSFLELYERARKVQVNLINVVEDPTNYLERERDYSGSFNSGNHAKPKDYDRFYEGVTLTPERLKLLELRFLPSCYFPSVTPYLEYIMLGGNMPTSKITNFDSCGDDD